MGLLGIQNDFTDQVESDSRRIQVVDGAQPLLRSGLFRASQAFRDQLIEQVNRVILGYGLEDVCESNQGGDAAFWWHTRNTGRPRRCRIAGKCL